MEEVVILYTLWGTRDFMDPFAQYRYKKWIQNISHQNLRNRKPATHEWQVEQHGWNNISQSEGATALASASRVRVIPEDWC